MSRKLSKHSIYDSCDLVIDQIDFKAMNPKINYTYSSGLCYVFELILHVGHYDQM